MTEIDKKIILKTEGLTKHYGGVRALDNGRIILKGKFQNNKLKSGKIISDGITEEGHFENENLRFGKITMDDGQILFGEFKNMKLIKGKIFFPDGTIQEHVF